MRQVDRPERDYDVALIFSGGNALGSYQAGAFEALQDAGIEPDRVAGASAGAINGAIICGSPPDRRVDNLKALWRPAGCPTAPMLEEARRTAAATWTMTMGQPGIFTPRNPLGSWWELRGGAETSSLYDATPLGGTIERLVDFELLNQGSPRFYCTAVDVETGEDVIFDTASHAIRAEHVRASAALFPAFAPIDVDGRLLCDSGISANLPLDGVLSELPERPLLCVAVDLLPLRGKRPATLGETTIRIQDLLFATQSRRAIAAWQAVFAERARGGDPASVTLLHIAYSDQAREISGKAFDYSPESAEARWQAGRADMQTALAYLQSGAVRLGAAGLSAHAAPGPGAALEAVHWEMGPVRG